MSNADFLKAQVDFMASGLFGSTIYYKSLSGKPESTVPWGDGIAAVVERSADPRGGSAEFGRSPILVVISKSNLTAVVPQVDKLKWNSHVYSVADIVSEDDGAFELYCTP